MLVMDLACVCFSSLPSAYVGITGCMQGSKDGGKRRGYLSSGQYLQCRYLDRHESNGIFCSFAGAWYPETTLPG